GGEVERGRRRQARVEGEVILGRAVRVDVVDEEAVEQKERVFEAALGEFLDAQGVVAEVEVDVHGEIGIDRHAQGAQDREKGAEVRLEVKGRQVQLEQHRVLAQEHAENLTGIVQDR